LHRGRALLRQQLVSVGAAQRSEGAG